MVQEIEDLEAQLQTHSLRDLGGLVQVEIRLDEMRATESVAAARADGSVGRYGKYSGHIGDGGTVGVTKLVNGFYSRTVWPLVRAVLPGIIRPAREQRTPWAASGVGYDGTHLPALS